MNRKTILKIMIDISMTIVFLILVNTSWTGLPLHEWLGLGILALFTAHLAINRQWISSAARNFATAASLRLKTTCILNLLLTFAMGSTIISGVLISQYAVPFLAAANLDLWYTVHAVSCWLTLVIVILHTAVHWRWIQNVIRRLAPARPSEQAGRLGRLAARTMIGLFALVAVYSLVTSSVIDLILPVSGSDRITGTTSAASQDTTQTTVVVATQDDEETVILPSPTTKTTTTAVTLQEYLSKLYCTACHNHCLLTRPKCARGVAQAEQATEKYNASLEASSSGT